MSSIASSTILVRRPRKSAPKSRTGCITCKIRRVKCGEERPSCIRCTSTGRKCDGYPPITNDYSSKVVVLRRETTPQQGVPTVKVWGDNVHYLEFYYHCAGPTMTMFSKIDKDFWSRTSLQMAQSEPSIRHALIALGYLNKSATGTLKEARAGLVAASWQQRTLLFHYNKAVTSLVQRISEPSYSPEIGLVACMLFVCIEFLRGNYDTSFEHFKSGLKVILAYKANQTQSPDKSSGPSSMIEGLLIPMFIRMTMTAIMYGLPTELVLLPSKLEFRERPFTSVLEAQLSYENIRNVAMLFMRSIGPKLMGLSPVTEADLQLHRDILEAHCLWLRALQDLEKKTTLSNEEEITVNSLKACYHCVYIFTAVATVTNQTAFDEHLDGFKAVIKHARFVLDSTKRISSNTPAANFTFETGAIPYLYFAASRCRCPTTRREALALLERNPPREGLWDAQQHAIVTRRIIDIEESEVDAVTGWPVERTRIWSTIVHGEMDANGKFQVYFARGIWGEGRGVPPLPPGMKLMGSPNGSMCREWFVL